MSYRAHIENCMRLIVAGGKEKGVVHDHAKRLGRRLRRNSSDYAAGECCGHGFGSIFVHFDRNHPENTR